MEKIKFITDSASDIPEEEARAYGIEVLPIPIAIDGKDYHERWISPIGNFISF